MFNDNLLESYYCMIIMNLIVVNALHNFIKNTVTSNFDFVSLNFLHAFFQSLELVF